MSAEVIVCRIVDVVVDGAFTSVVVLSQSQQSATSFAFHLQQRRVSLLTSVTTELMVLNSVFVVVEGAWNAVLVWKRSVWLGHALEISYDCWMQWHMGKASQR